MGEASKHGRWVEIGKIMGAIPVKMGVLNLLLIVTDKALILASIKTSLLKTLIMPRGVSRLMEARALVKLAKMSPDELAKYLGEHKGEISFLGFITRDKIVSIEFKRGFLGIGLVKLSIHTVDGKKIDLSLIYGKGTGISKDEAVNNALEKIQSLGVKIEKKI